MNLIVSVWRRMFSYMYEFNFPKYDYNANSIEVQQRSNVREKSARERSKLRRSKSSHSLDCKVRPKSHRFRREKDFDPRYYYNENNQLKLIDLEEENASTNFSAWCVSFDSEKVKFTIQPASDPLDYRKRDYAVMIWRIWVTCGPAVQSQLETTSYRYLIFHSLQTGGNWFMLKCNFHTKSGL